MHSVLRLGIVAAIIVAIHTGLEAQQQTPAPAAKDQADSKNVIEIGQTVDQAQEILRKRKIGFHDGGLAVEKVEDQGHFTFQLDEERHWIAVFYSQSKKTVTHITLIAFPSKESHGKVNESWLSAKSMKLEDDGSYAVHFLPPLKEKKENTKNELPPTKLQTQK